MCAGGVDEGGDCCQWVGLVCCGRGLGLFAEEFLDWVGC